MVDFYGDKKNEQVASLIRAQLSQRVLSAMHLQTPLKGQRSPPTLLFSTISDPSVCYVRVRQIACVEVGIGETEQW